MLGAHLGPQTLQLSDRLSSELDRSKESEAGWEELRFIKVINNPEAPSPPAAASLSYLLPCAACEMGMQGI